ncbi:MAG: M23 family metallopeptidase [Syntrophomonadaceae bacterium]|nr:M23 family metallopeptidase [Syntrophomonadaceae bacterium]
MRSGGTAAAEGVVTTASYDAGGYGNNIIIGHVNMTLYAHLNQMRTGVGQTVMQGQTIGFVGSTGMSTGPHLHFEGYVGGTRVGPCCISPIIRRYGKHLLNCTAKRKRLLCYLVFAQKYFC